jgi:ADP-heptose:LPS heptosyltransferase
MLGHPPEAVRPVFQVPAEADRRALELLPGLLPPGGGPVVGVQIPHRGSTRHAVRAWPKENVVALVRALVADGCRVVLCGTGAERVEAESVKSLIPAAAVSPAVPLAVFAALQSRFDLFVSQFTGTLHLADAVGVPVVAFGLEEQVQGWGAIGPQHRNIAASRVSEIPVETVLEAARASLAGAAARAGRGKDS